VAVGVFGVFWVVGFGGEGVVMGVVWVFWCGLLVASVSFACLLDTCSILLVGGVLTLAYRSMSKFGWVFCSVFLLWSIGWPERIS